MRYTRTHTHFFSDEDLMELQNVYDKLHDDWVGRSPYMDDEVRHAGDIRLRTLEAALILLREPAG